MADLKSIRDVLRTVPDRLRDTAAVALYEAAVEHVEGPAKDNCPFQDGTLSGTIQTLPPDIEGGKIVVRVVAGGPAAPYAIAVHEHLSGHSPASWRKCEESGKSVMFQTGGPKYLERALIDAKDTILDGVAKRIELVI